jgi:polyhydroxybutyrate depolymerase
MKGLALIALAITPLGACRPHGTSSVQVGNRERHYELFVPTDTPNLPLVIALHGQGSTGRQMERFTRFDSVAAREQFVVVYPDAIDHHWNDGRPETDNGADDVAFIGSLIDEMAAAHGIDRTRVYITGASNGGMMSYRLGCEMPDRIAGIAPVIGNLPASIVCAPRVPLSVLAINGTKDPLVPYTGGTVARGRGTVLSAALSTSVFARAAGCAGAQPTIDEPEVDLRDGSHTRRTDYACPPDVDVELITLEGAGHTWPGGPQYLPRFLIGGTSRDFDGAERIWDFFSAHTRS